MYHEQLCRYNELKIIPVAEIQFLNIWQKMQPS